ncbi:hypothetical protein Tco_1205654 [Tanacetum coccineum]
MMRMRKHHFSIGKDYVSRPPHKITPDFNECEDDFTDSDNESSGVNNEETKNKEISDVDSEVEEIPKTIFEQGVQGGIKSNATSEKPNEVMKEVHSSDQFNIFELLNKKNSATNETQQPEGEPKYPPEFTPRDVSEVNSNMEHNSTGKDFESNQNNQESADIPKSGGSILQLIEDLINVSQTMGYNMDGCINNFEEIVKNQEAQDFIDGFYVTEYSRTCPKGQKRLGKGVMS